MDRIPQEISSLIFRKFSIREGKRLERVSRTWRQYYTDSITEINIAENLSTAHLLGILSRVTESQILSFNCPASSIDSDVAQFLCKLHNLQSFSGRFESQLGLDILVSKFKKLTNLDLYVDGSALITSDYLESLLASKEHLTRLCITGAGSLIQRMRNLPMLENLKELIIERILGFTKDGLLDIAEMKKLKKLRISDVELDDMGFRILLSSLTNLEDLSIGDNNLQIDSWSGLTKLEKLKKLEFLQSNLIMTELFNSFGCLTNLTSLNFATFHVNPQDFQSLSKLSNNLNELAITLRGGKQPQRFLNVNSIGQLTNLTSLIILNGMVPSEIELKRLVNLRSLIFTEINPTKFTELMQLTNLTNLEVENDQLSAWQWNKFTSLVNLQTLSLSYNAITTIPLSQMSNLTYLAIACEGRHVKELSKLTQLKKLQLYCQNFTIAQIEQLANLDLDHLEQLSLSNLARGYKNMFKDASCRITWL